MGQPTRSRNWRRMLYLLGGLALLAGGVKFLEMTFPGAAGEGPRAGPIPPPPEEPSKGALGYS